jgi:hypothetical protein
LLGCPLRGWMGRHRKMHDSSALMRQHIEDLEPDRRDKCHADIFLATLKVATLPFQGSPHFVAVAMFYSDLSKFKSASNLNRSPEQAAILGRELRCLGAIWLAKSAQNSDRVS